MENHGTITGPFPTDGWRAARSCGPNGGNCVEVNLGRGSLVGVRDTKPASRPILAFGGAEWGVFLDAARSGRLDHA